MANHMKKTRRAILAGGVFALYGACKPSLTLPLGEQRKPTNGAGRGPSRQPVPTAPTPETDDAPSHPTLGTHPDTQRGTSSTLDGLMVALDVGHSAEGADLGAFSQGISEHKLNSREANRIAELLRAKGARVSVFYYRSSESLVKRGQNAGNHHIFLSIHHNAAHTSSVQGTEVLINHPDHRSADQELAQNIQAQLVRGLWGNSPGIKDRGAKAQSLGVLRNTPASVQAAVLTEPFFITHSGLSPDQAERMIEISARAIADGIESYWLRSTARPLMQNAESATDGISNRTAFVPWDAAEDPLGLYTDH